MIRLTVRHCTAEDVVLRSSVLHDPDVQANLSGEAAVRTPEQLVADQIRTIDREQDRKRILTVLRGREVVGFFWITTIDWRAQTCELSIVVLPRFRHAFGLPLVDAAEAYVYLELNMQVVVGRVLEHNVMMHSPQRLRAMGQVRAEYNQFMAGRWRTCVTWTKTVEQYRENDAESERRRRQRAERIRARLTDRAWS